MSGWLVCIPGRGCHHQLLVPRRIVIDHVIIVPFLSNFMAARTAAMYRSSSPIFDVPEFPALRNVKPLPKRRRTTQGNNDPNGTNTPSATFDLGFRLTMGMAMGLTGPDATLADEVLAHADSISAQMALSSYYMPILGGVQDLLNDELDSNSPSSVGLGLFRGQKEEALGDGDYADQLQHPGNTKKRKVPANASVRARDTCSSQSGGEEEQTERSIFTGRREDNDLGDSGPSTTATIVAQRKGKITPTTLAGLQHKEILKNRKRQLAAVLGALSQGDTLALDQALSGSYPFVSNGLHDLRNSKPPKIRLSHRKGPRLVRAASKTTLLRHPDAAPFPECEFTFTFPSASKWPSLLSLSR
jgi:hypothetical protein